LYKKILSKHMTQMLDKLYSLVNISDLLKFI
jgi:hypothetical protein